jgi:hypothetical protein
LTKTHGDDLKKGGIYITIAVKSRVNNGSAFYFKMESCMGTEPRIIDLRQNLAFMGIRGVSRIQLVFQILAYAYLFLALNNPTFKSI